MTRPHEGFVHDAAFFGSDEEFLDIVVPFLSDGVTAGEPTFASFPPDNQRRVLQALDKPSAIAALHDLEQYDHPLDTLVVNRRLFRRHAEWGASHLRFAGQLPSQALAGNWESWARCEAAINHVHAPFPVSVLCLYDTRAVPPSVLDDVERTHLHIRTAGRHRRASPRYTRPDVFLAERARADFDPLEQQPPHLVLLDPSLAVARREVAALGTATGLDPRDLEGLLLAVSETVHNAQAHGRPPVTLQAWSVTDRILVTVHDRGSGPDDPYAGLLPGEDAGSGRHGLWMAHRMCTRASLTHAPDGCTVRLLAGTPAGLRA